LLGSTVPSLGDQSKWMLPKNGVLRRKYNAFAGLQSLLPCFIAPAGDEFAGLVGGGFGELAVFPCDVNRESAAGTQALYGAIGPVWGLKPGGELTI